MFCVFTDRSGNQCMFMTSISFSITITSASSGLIIFSCSAPSQHIGISLNGIHYDASPFTVLSILVPSVPPTGPSPQKRGGFVPVLWGFTSGRAERNVANLETSDSGFGALGRRLGRKYRVQEPVEKAASCSSKKAKPCQWGSLVWMQLICLPGTQGQSGQRLGGGHKSCLRRRRHWIMKIWV